MDRIYTMEVTQEESEVKVKEEAADTNIQSQGQIDLIPDWKLNRTAECRDTGILPSMESQVRWSTFGGPQMDKGQDGTEVRREHGEEFIGDPLQTQTPSLDDEIDIKYEEYGIENNSTSTADGDCDIDPGSHSVVPNMNPKSASQSPIDSKRIELSEFYLRLLQCEQNCETCQKYMQELSEHVRATHSVAQQTHDPLDIDPHDADQSSAIQIKSEVEEDIEIEREQSFAESESDSDFTYQSENERDPDYTISTGLTRNERGKGNSEKDPLSDDKKNHTGKEESKPRFNCTDCGKGFAVKSLLTTHIRTHTGERPFKCPDCEKTFSQKGHLTIHMRSHTGERPYQCSVCLKGFLAKNSLVIHMRGHTGDKPFKCTQCDKCFAFRDKLGQHMRSHTGEKPFRCGECNKNFSQKGNLDLHMRCHTGEKPFKCSQCAKSFTQKWTLDYHIRSHTGEKPFKCHLCHKSLASKRNLRVHVKSHTEGNLFKCDKCNKIFAQKKTFDSHMNNHTAGNPP